MLFFVLVSLNKEVPLKGMHVKNDDLLRVIFFLNIFFIIKNAFKHHQETRILFLSSMDLFLNLFLTIFI